LECGGFEEETPRKPGVYMSGKQLAGNKLRKRIEHILGKPAVAVFMNGTLPHNLAQAWVSNEDAYLVNIKTKNFIEYIIGGKHLLRRAIRIVRKTVTETTVVEEQTWVNKAQELIAETNGAVPIHMVCGDVILRINNGLWCEKCGLTPADKNVLWANKGNVNIYVPELNKNLTDLAKQRANTFVKEAYTCMT
jgi:hypothetical protein